MVNNWNEADHPRDEEGKFTYKNGGVSRSSGSNIQERADILYPTMKDKKPKINYDNIGLSNYYNKNLSREDILYPTMKSKNDNGGYIENLKEPDLFKRYENNQLDMLKQNAQNKSIETAPRWSNNTKFSDDELKRARIFIQGAEEIRSDAYYPTKNDVLTIGYGHTKEVDGKPITLGMKITKEKAEELYRKDFEEHIAPLKNVEVPLTSNQKIALASFLFNLGPNILSGSELLKKLNAGDYKGASDEMDKYNKQRNKKTGEFEVVRGLVNRRASEKKLFFTPDGE